MDCDIFRMNGNLEQIVCSIVHQHEKLTDARKHTRAMDVIASILMVLALSLSQFWSGHVAFSQTISRHSSRVSTGQG